MCLAFRAGKNAQNNDIKIGFKTVTGVILVDKLLELSKNRRSTRKFSNKK